MMNYDQMVNTVARRLYGKSRREVREVLDVLFDVWREELQQPDASLHIRNLGRLYVEQQQIPITGIIRQTMSSQTGWCRAVPTLSPLLPFHTDR